MFSTKIFILLACSLAIAMATPVDNVQMDGDVHKYTGEELKKAQIELQDTLNRLTGDGHSYEISKVISASSQIVSGVLTKINANLIDSEGEIRNCNISIWAQPWLPNGIQATFDCAGQKTFVEKFSA